MVFVDIESFFFTILCVQAGYRGSEGGMKGLQDNLYRPPLVPLWVVIFESDKFIQGKRFI